MKTELAQEIIHCLPEDRTLFHYYKDYYAVYLLQREIMSAGIDQVAQLKRCRYANLTAKPVIKSLLANRGSGEISAEDFETLWSDDYETYVLTLGSWGQTMDTFKLHGQGQISYCNLILVAGMINDIVDALAMNWICSAFPVIRSRLTRPHSPGHASI